MQSVILAQHLQFIQGELMKTYLKNLSLNSMTSFLTAVAVIASFAVNTTAEARGGADSGGGGAFVCPLTAPGKNGHWFHSELIDLWEARSPDVYNLPLVRSDAPVDLQLKKALAKLDKYDSQLGQELYDLAHKLFAEKISVSKETELQPPDDALAKFGKKGCPAKGMMYYDGERQRLFVDEPVFDALISNTDKAAGMLHEAWYYLARNSPEAALSVENSIKTRRMVGCLFSESTSCLENIYKQQFEKYRFLNYRELINTSKSFNFFTATEKLKKLSCKNSDLDITMYLDPEDNGRYFVLELNRYKNREFKMRTPIESTSVLDKETEKFVPSVLLRQFYNSDLVYKIDELKELPMFFYKGKAVFNRRAFSPLPNLEKLDCFDN